MMTAATAPRPVPSLNPNLGLPRKVVARSRESCAGAPTELLLCPFVQGVPMKEAPPSHALLKQARQGDREALGRLLEARRAALHRLAKRQLDGRIAVRVDASDIIQQTFLEAHRSFPQFAGRDPRELTAWLQIILDHKVAGAIRDHTLLQKRDVHRDRSMDD